MYDETNVPDPEYRVRTVVRHVVTRYCHPYTSRDGRHGSSGSSEVIAEAPNEERAYEIAEALAKAENRTPLPDHEPVKPNNFLGHAAGLAVSGDACESGSSACGPVEHYDEDVVPLCKKCWDSLEQA